MINDMIFQLAAQHCLRNLDGSDPNNLVFFNECLKKTYNQLLESYNALSGELPSPKKKSNTVKVHSF